MNSCLCWMTCVLRALLAVTHVPFPPQGWWMGVERNLRLHLRPLPKEDLRGQRVSTLDQRGDGICAYLSCKCLTKDSFCLFLGVGQNCGLWTKDGRSSAAPNLQRRQREGQVIHFDVQLWCRGKCLMLSVMVTRVVFLLSPTPHLHFSIKHPHTLSWEYYKMFQCKAHLVMRLIENRISMEFMLQVALHSSSSDQNFYPSIILNVFFPPPTRFLTSFWVWPAQPHPRNTRVRCGVRCWCPLTASSSPSPTSLGKTSAPWSSSGCILHSPVCSICLNFSLISISFPAALEHTKHSCVLLWSSWWTVQSRVTSKLRTRHQRRPHGVTCITSAASIPAALSLSKVTSGTFLNLIRINFSSGLNRLCWIPGYWAPVWAGCVLSAAFALLHLFSVFNSSRLETRVLWWNSLAVLPSTGSGMCSSWRSVRTTHHLVLRNMWWALRHSVWNECECVSIKQEQLKLKAGVPNTAKRASLDVHTLLGM